jgi:peptidoglycan/LPS O-acetylase OafA/YrhL
MYRRDKREILDTIRWISAFMVAGGHMWAAVAAHQPGLMSKALWILADTPHCWVIIFFSLSGYLVGGGALVRAERFNFKLYALARVTRIYIVLIPALLLTAGLDGLAHQLAPHSPVYANVWGNGLFGSTPPFARYGPREIIASLLSLENFIGPPIGSDGPLWSLGFEWAFYLGLPPLLLAADAIGRRIAGRLWIARAAAVIVSVAILTLLHMPYVALLWLVWLAGAGAHAIALTGRWPRALSGLGAGACALGFGLASSLDYHFCDALIGFGAAAFLSRFPPGERGLNARFDSALAGASYSLYVTHLPVTAFVCMLLVQAGVLTPAGLPLGSTLALVIGCLVLTASGTCVIFYLLFERRTDALRRLLSKPSPQLNVASATAAALKS